ncbi:MAG: Fe-S cluster protein [Desulfatibacillum sp.]|nr:Fe-S cluster protein [Desulfatibacillum sp.]
MLLTGWTKEIFRPECNPSFESVHCRAHLSEDVGEALPYLNAVLGGTQYFAEPPQVMFHHHGRIIKVGASEIAINALTDEAEADKVLTWLQNEINEAWENRGSITPCYKGREQPKLIEILKLLPKTNCKKCGQPTCMVFAAQVREGGRGIEACPELTPPNRTALEQYLSRFDLEA